MTVLTYRHLKNLESMIVRATVIWFLFIGGIINAKAVTLPPVNELDD